MIHQQENHTDTAVYEALESSKRFFFKYEKRKIFFFSMRDWKLMAIIINFF